nr:hypothetical protein [Anaerolineae bacterium]
MQQTKTTDNSTRASGISTQAELRRKTGSQIAGRCDVIVTKNLKDFPLDVLAPYGIETRHPDDFLSNHLNLYPGPFCEAV